MNVLLYAKGKGEITETLGRIIDSCVRKKSLEKYSTISGLSQRLRRPTNNLGIAVIAVTTKRQLQDIVAIRHLLSDIRIILIVPDRAPDTVSAAHTLSPRFLTYMDSDFICIKAVLAKMLQSSNTSNIELIGSKKSKSKK